MIVDPKNCSYCNKNGPYNDLFTYICDLRVSTLVLFKEQDHLGRVVIYYNKGHAEEFCELPDEDVIAMAQDLAQASKAVKAAFGCNKLNIGSYGDRAPHFHFHICPKYEGMHDFGGIFKLRADEPYLPTEAEKQEIIAKIKACL